MDTAPKPVPAPNGRPPLLTPEVIAEVARLLPTCLYLETVGDYLNIDRTTWRKWLRRGRKEADRLRKASAVPREKEALYLEFFHAYKKALAQGELDDAASIQGASKGQWQAAAWRLERRFPERWGKKDALDLKASVDMKAKHEHGVSPPLADYLAAYDALALAARPAVSGDDGGADQGQPVHPPRPDDQAVVLPELPAP